jgi:Tfp pilus assembly protein PilV
MACRTTPISTRRAPGRHRGFGLAEGLIASVVLATAVVAVSAAINASYAQTATMSEDVRMTQLAQQLLEEIAAKPLGDPDRTPPTDTVIAPDEATRSQYDDVGDYNGYTDRSDDLQTAGGQAIASSDGPVYTRTVSVEFRDQPQGPASRWGDMALISVSVNSSSGLSLRLSRLVTRTSWSR